MNIIQPGPIPVNGNAPATVRRRELVQKVLVEGSIPALERLLVIGVCKSSKFYGRLKELDIAPHVPNGVPGSRRPDFQHPDYARAFPLIADFREGNAGVDAIGPELVDVFLTGIVEQRRLTIEDKERILAWLKPELVEPEWENTGPIFAMLDAPVFREWRYGAVARYELNRLHIQASTETRIVPARDIEAALKNIQEAGRVTRLFPEIIDAVDFQAKKLEEPKQLVQGIWHQGSKLSLGGSSKAFKSWSFYDLAIAIAAGESWLGFKTHKGRVLLV
ncbi:MAG: AAA family ATPase, partial [Verrucomicrobia bacterium]|nr:AAA family ATPase [Verrucomicrobiota bacterium]